MLDNAALTVKSVTLHPIATRLVTPFVTSFGEQTLRAGALVRVVLASGAEGWGEVTANWDADYSYETVHTALHILRDHLIPRLLAAGTCHLTEPWPWLEGVRGNPIAKHALITAMLTALALERNIPYAQLLQDLAGVDSRRTRIEGGVSIGIQPSIDDTLQTVQDYLTEGYRRIKLKIKPRWDVEPLRQVRAAFPDAVIMADANSAYRLEDAAHLRGLDELGLLMIEQPLGYDDIYEHSLLAPQLTTPLCLDESLNSLGDVKLAHHLKACRIVNLKPQRVGGPLNAVAIYQFCVANGLGLWVGGMLETGIGRAASMALASLPGFTLPADLSASKRYYDPDLAEPPFELDPADSTLPVPHEAGLGVRVDIGRVAAAEQAFKLKLTE